MITSPVEPLPLKRFKAAIPQGTPPEQLREQLGEITTTCLLRLFACVGFHVLLYPISARFHPLHRPLTTYNSGLLPKTTTCSVPQILQKQDQCVTPSLRLKKILPCPLCARHPIPYIQEHRRTAAMTISGAPIELSNMCCFFGIFFTD